jgi:hypothetical protein
LRDILQNSQKEVIICTNAEEVFYKKNLFKQTFDDLSRNNIKINIDG